MLQKFLSVFTWWKSRDRRDTPKAPAPWPNPAGHSRRVQPEQMAPFKTGTPHDRMHDLIVAGKPDALIAIELGVDIAAVRNYRHIISARARNAARWAAGEAKVPHMLARGDLDELGLDLRTVQNIREAMLIQRRRQRVPAVLLRRAEELDERVRINETYGKLSGWNYYDPSDSFSPRPAPSDSFSSDQGGDFGGVDTTGSLEEK